ncbi:allophanate hydrolase subunit 2 [Zymobacter palmae]|uniref:Allophanate hydrolase subunit 2 n=1 Tax=Zymobacter palmae TaxID=33074 RepID=A0A348HGT3_9GAMM|nr:allophanate hydrolase subunit 2 [Zymobacter palmae]
MPTSVSIKGVQCIAISSDKKASFDDEPAQYVFADRGGADETEHCQQDGDVHVQACLQCDTQQYDQPDSIDGQCIEGGNAVRQARADQYSVPIQQAGQ